MKHLSEGLEWGGFCLVWQLVGTWFAIRDASPEERANPEFIATLFVNTQAQLASIAIGQARLIDMAQSHDEDIEELRDLNLGRLARRRR